MKPRINMLGIVTHQLEEMKVFYRDVLGFSVLLEVEGNFVEFHNDGVRFALTTGEVMVACTEVENYKEKASGHSFELAFLVHAPHEVDATYERLIDKGATPIKPAADQPWGQRTAFFADPDGHIHEIFTDLPK